MGVLGHGVHCELKTRVQDTTVLSVTLPNVAYFENYFTSEPIDKVVVKQLKYLVKAKLH